MTYQVSANDASQRIDKFLKRMLKDAPLSFIYRMFRQKDVKINGKKAKIDDMLEEGDVVDIYLKPVLLEQFHKDALVRPVKVDFGILYEDQKILITDKPRGLLVHAENGETAITLQNMVLNYLATKGEWDKANLAGFVPSPAHRLDRNTSGIVVFGKTLPALQQLLELFRNRDKIEKKYMLLCRGQTDASGSIDFPIIKDSEKHMVRIGRIERGAKTALTVYHRIKAYSCGFSLVEAELMTGRTHQLRIHFAAIGHPIVGDSKYGDFAVNETFEKLYSFHNQFLHASYFGFRDDIGGTLDYLSGKSFISPLPPKEKEILDSLSRTT